MTEIGVAAQIVDRVFNHKSDTIRGVAAIDNRYSHRKEACKELLARSELLRAVVG